MKKGVSSDTPLYFSVSLLLWVSLFSFVFYSIPAQENLALKRVDVTDHGHARFPCILLGICSLLCAILVVWV